MTVRELMRKLKKKPPGAEVIYAAPGIVFSRSEAPTDEDDGPSERLAEFTMCRNRSM